VGDRDKLRRRRGPGLWFSAVLLIEFLLREVLGSRWIVGRPAVQAVLIAVAAVVLVAGGYKTVVEYRRKKRERIEVRATGRWPTGSPHVIALDAHSDGSRVEGTLVFESDGLRVDPAPSLVPDVIPFADVATVRVRSAWIEVETRLWKFRVVPASYEDRQRLLWEFALRCNAAMERGIDEAAGAERTLATALKPSPAAPRADEPPPAATRSGDTDSLDRGMSSLGSALAGPAQRRNPAPPRKSGLGNGLFPIRDADAN